jgi:hypothetical protein
MYVRECAGVGVLEVVVLYVNYRILIAYSWLIDEQFPG